MEQRAELPAEAKPATIREIMAKTADWQLANPNHHHPAAWHQATFYAGLTVWAQMADSPKYYEALVNIGDKNDWRPHHRFYHADDHAVGQMYVQLYRHYRDPKMIDICGHLLAFRMSWRCKKSSIKSP